jgi:hypothetical protein
VTLILEQTLPPQVLRQQARIWSRPALLTTPEREKMNQIKNFSFLILQDALNGHNQSVYILKEQWLRAKFEI